MSDCENPLYDATSLELLRRYGLHARIDGNGGLRIGPPEKIDNDMRAFIALERAEIIRELEVELLPQVPT